MAESVLSISDFKAKLKGGGARPSLFKVILNFPPFAAGNVELTSFMCKGAQIPSSNIPTIPVLFRGRTMQVAGDRIFDPLQVTVINDTDFHVRNAIERWMNAINAHSTNTGLVNPSDYQSDLVVEQLDRDSTVLKSYKFRSAFPTVLSPIELNYDAQGVIEEFTVEFAYLNWDAETTT